jgi:prepilin-type N-terminal cleavage/methylation domain-containing protein
MRQGVAVKRLSGSSGVTLVELLIVVTIIGIVAGIAIPKIDLTRYRVDGAMQSAGMTLLGAQRLAATRQFDVIVGFDQANNAIRVHQDANNNGVVDGGEPVTQRALGDLVVFGRAGAAAHAVGAAAVTFTQMRNGLPSVTFHRNGSASEYGGIYLTSRRAVLAGLATDSRLLEVERSTGRTSWYRYNNGWIRGF